jgi:lipoprotein signal peptidase
VLACIASVGTGALIRENLRPGQSSWLVSRTIYLVRDQHLGAPFPFLPPTLTLVLWPVLAIAVVSLIRGIRVGNPGLSVLPEIVAGLFIGGALANALEAETIGSVTDFLGIYLAGTYSAGDIAMDISSSLLPIAAIHITRAQHRTFTHVVSAGAVFYLAVVLFAVVVSRDYALAILATLVAAGGAAISFTRRMISTQIPSV